MATLIAANYQSESSTAYGFMTTYGIKLKNNTLYTLKCRYKWDKNGTESSGPLACYLYEGTWSYGGASYYFPETPTTYQTLIHKFTTPGDVSSYTFAIANYATNGSILSVDWYELWEGDATEFSLADAYELGTTNMFKWGDKPSSISGISNNGSSILLDSSTFGYNVYKCVSASHSSQMYIFYNSAALTSSLVTGKTYLATAEIYSPDSNTCNIDIEYSTILASSRSITPGKWSKVWVIGTRYADGAAVTFYAPPGTYYYKNIHIAETPTSFLDLQGSCSNPSYFSGLEPDEALRSWMGYYYEVERVSSGGEWEYTYNHYSSASRSRTVSNYIRYSNGKVVNTGGNDTEVEDATVTYGNWSYNWTTTGNSTRSRTVTYSWSDYSSTATQTETGGVRYLVLSDEKHVGDHIGEIKHTFPANGSGSKTFTVYSHDYWGGTNIATNVIYDASCSCDGFKCSVSGSTLTVTASNLGTTEKAYHKATIVTSKSGFESRAGYTGIAQEANVRTLSSVYLVPYKPDNSWVVDVTNGNWNTCPASVGFVKASGYANYTHTSGTPLNDQHITSDAALTWSTGYNSWITNHDNGGYRIHSRGTTTGSARSSNATWSYGGKTSSAKTLTQAENKITSYNNPSFDMWWSTGTGNANTPVPASGGTSSSPTYSVYQTGVYSSGDTGEVTPNITYKNFSIESKDTAASASVNSSTGVVTFGSIGKTVQNGNTHAVVKLTITSHGKTVSDEGWCHQAPNYKTPVYGDINIFDFVYYGIGYTAGNNSLLCRYTQTCSYSYSSGDTENASNVSGQAGDGYTSFQRISGNSSASVNSSTGVVSWGTNTGSSSRSATIRVTVSRNGKTSTKDAVATQSGAPTYGSWEFVEVSSDTIEPIPVWENAVFTCTYRRTTPTGGYEYKDGSCSPSEYYNDGSGGSVWVTYYDPDGRYGGQKQFMLESEY